MAGISVCETVKCVLIPGYVRKYETQMRTSFSQEEIQEIRQMGNIPCLILQIALSTLMSRALLLQHRDLPLVSRIGVEAGTFFGLGLICKFGLELKDLSCCFYQRMNERNVRWN